MKKGNVVFVIGVSGCGKSTVAKALAEKAGGVFLEGDEFHPPENVAAMSAGIPLTDEMRWGWLSDLAEAARIEATNGKDTFVACSGLKKSYRTLLRDVSDSTQMVLLAGSKDLILARMKARSDHYMPPALLDSQFAALELPADDEADVVTVNIDQPAARVIAQTETLVFSSKEGLAQVNPKS